MTRPINLTAARHAAVLFAQPGEFTNLPGVCFKQVQHHWEVVPGVNVGQPGEFINPLRKKNAIIQ